MTNSPAPPAPPPPPQPKSKVATVKLSSKVSGFIKKLQEAPHGYWYEPEIRPEHVDVLAPPVGPYFFYGTLMDPSLLSEILDLTRRPRLRPAKLVGYSLKLWGQYPALVNGPPGAIVKGAVYEVEHESHARRLAEYETTAYQSSPCNVSFTDGEEPAFLHGTAFKYVGNPIDIDEGQFDLDVWLRRMGRGEHKEEEGNISGSALMQQSLQESAEGKPEAF